jgi:hypothetical protein
VACSPRGTGSYSVFAKVNDSNGGSATSPTATLSVSGALSGVSVAVSVSALDVGQSLTMAATYSGGSGGDTFSWTGLPAGCVGANAATLSCSPTAAGSSTPAVTVKDSNGATVHATDAAAVVVSPDPTATALVITSLAGAAVGMVVEGTAVTFTLTSTSGSGGDTIVWTGLPAGCTPSSADATSVGCAPTADGSYSVSARVTDSNGVSVPSPAAGLTISAPPAASAPFATSFQWLELALLALLVVLALVGVLFALRRPPSRGGGRLAGSPPPEPPPATRTSTGGSTGPPEYSE